MKTLTVLSSIRGDASVSTEIALSLRDKISASQPHTENKVLRLADAGPGLLSIDDLATPTKEQTEAMEDFLAADTLILGVPMYNLSAPAQFKNWIDAICRAGQTFKYTENGPVGLTAGKKAYLVISTGGKYQGTQYDTLSPWLKNVLGLMGVTNVDIIWVEGLNMGADMAAQAIRNAEERIQNLIG